MKRISLGRGKITFDVILVALVAGCATLQTPTTQISSAPRNYHAVTISYRVDSRYLSNANRPSTSAGTLRTLSLQFPHPKCKPGFARAELVIETASASGVTSTSTGALSRLSQTINSSMPGVQLGDGISEAWAAEVPIADVEHAIEVLDNQGYFGDSALPTSGVFITAQVDGVSMQKGWHALKELDALIMRLRKEGSLVSHHGRSTPTEQLIAAALLTEPVITRLPPVGCPE